MRLLRSLLQFGFHVISGLSLFALSCAFGLVWAMFFCWLRFLHAMRCVFLAKNVPLIGSSIVVTGAAGGFGRCTVKRLSEMGVTVYALDIVSVEEMKEKIFPEFPRVVPIQCDVSNLSEVQNFASRLVKENVKLFALVNNAGVTGTPSAAAEVSHENIKHVFDVNFFAAVALTRELFSCMHQAPRNVATSTPRRRGRVINVSSVAGLVSSSGLASYSSSKAALESYTDSLRMELRDRMDISLIEPFFAHTGIYNEFLAMDPHDFDKSILCQDFKSLQEKFINLTKTKSSRLMSPDCVAAIIIQALTEQFPRDRYVVAPMLVRGAVQCMMHWPNYFGLVDRCKDLMKKLQ